jgi:hypothetical protein
MNKVNSKYYCEYCDKYYKSQPSFCNHNKRFHAKKQPKSTSDTQNNSISTQNNSMYTQNNSNNIKNNNLECNYCSKIFSRSDNLNRHYKTCKMKINIEIENLELKKEITELKAQIKELMNKQCKIHYKTLQKINNNNINNNNINNIQNNTQNNNINIIGFNKENLLELFSDKEKLNILKKKYNSLNYFIEYAHFNNKYPQLKNIKITNLKDNIAYKYDSEKNKFIATTKDDLINDLVISRMTDIDEFQTEIYDKLSKKEQDIIKNMLDEFYNDEDKYKDKKKEDIKFIIYNNSEHSN